MTPERYLRINALADAALELPEEKRSAFLEAECAGDPELRRQLEQLLGAHTSENTLMQAPLLEQLAQDIVTTPAGANLAGKQFHHYQILSRIGAGGIGEVWLAKDLRLGRQVALKVLSPISAADPEQIRRFEREARAASSLNHPNIVTIYEVGSAEGLEFIAQEFVEGETLRQRLACGPMPFAEVLDIGAQAASALAAAHGAGIIHRDMKPENIMMRPDGLLKVLDFGLARSVVRTHPGRSSEAGNLSITRPGFVIGTAKYMSPEQARGMPLDERSDIFSLGIVLYEIASGIPPFRGRTSSDIVAAILAQDPQPISDRMPDVPRRFEAVLRKCLEKDPGKRYGSAQDLRLDLERLLHAIEKPTEDTPAPQALLKTRDKAARRLAFGMPRWNLWPWAVAGMVAAALALAGWWISPRGQRVTAISAESDVMTRMITQGTVADTAISPHGDFVAYFLDEPGGQSLWLRKIAGSQERRILAPEPGGHTGLAFSSSGKHVTWLRSAGDGGFALYRMPVEGGTAVLLRNGLNSAVAFSPDGDQYGYFQIDPIQRESALMVANTHGTGVRTIAVRERPRYFSRYGLAWSPDRRYIACFEGDASSYTEHAFHLTEIRVADGKERRLGTRDWLWAGSMTWPAPGIILASATTRLDDAYQIWSVSVPDGAVSKVTNDLSNYSRIGASEGAQTIIAIQTQSSVDQWALPGGAADRAVRITSGDVRGFNSLAWTPDGRIVYSALAGDYRNIWMVGPSGENLRQLTSGAGDKAEVNVTPDGKYILYHSVGSIWRMNLDGSHPLELTHGPDDVHPDASSDSRFVFYASFRDWCPGIAGKPTLWRVPINGGDPVRISEIAASVPRVSPDGKLLMCAYFPALDPQLSSSDVAVLRSQGGEPVKVFDNLPASHSFASWGPGGRAIEFSRFDKGSDNIWRMPLTAGSPHPVTAFTTGSIAGYAWSRDGAKLAVARANTTRDIVLIRAGNSATSP
jgi:serine/threonine protein kinase/Tol biopolymer transport system component